MNTTPAFSEKTLKVHYDCKLMVADQTFTYVKSWLKVNPLNIKIVKMSLATH